MSRSASRSILVGVCMLLLVSWFSYGLSFVPPTPLNDTQTTNTSALINISVNASTLDTLTYTWNQTNYSVYDDSLLLMYNFDNVSSIGDNSSVATSLARASNANITGPSYASGRHASSLNFTATGQRVDTNVTISQLQGGVTFSAWIYPRSYGGGGLGRIFDVSDTTCAREGINMFVNDVERFEVDIDCSGSTVKSTPYSVPHNSWSYVTATINSSGTVRLYVNGQYDTTKDFVSLSTLDTPSTLRVGAFSGGGDNRVFSGRIDEPRIWSRVLSEDEIQHHYISNLAKITSTNWTYISNETNLSFGEYTFSATANTTLGANVATGTRRISVQQSIAPTHDTPILNSSLATNFSAEDLTAYAQNVSDVDGDDVSLNFDWRRDGTSIAMLNMPFNVNISTNETGSVVDYSSFTNNGSLGNGSSFTMPKYASSCVVGGCYDFTRANKTRINIPEFGIFDGLHEFTVSLWVYAYNFSDSNTAGDSQTPMQFTSENFALIIFGDVGAQADQLSFRTNIDTWETPVKTRSLNESTWYHYTISYHPVDGFVLYLDGQVEDTNSKAGAFYDTSGGEPSSFIGGQNRDTGNKFFDGRIDEVLVFNRTLSSQQVANVYSEQNSVLLGNTSTTSTLSYHETRVGDGWSVAVTPSDGVVDGETKTSSAITILKEDIFSNNSFVTTWDTALGSPNDTVSLPLESDGTYDFRVDWGDDIIDTITAWNQSEVTHTYSSPGVYNVTITGAVDGWRFNGGGDAHKLLDISQWGNVSLGDNADQFRGAQNLSISAQDVLNTSGMTSFDGLFRDSGVSVIPGIDEWNVSSISSMQFVFANSSFNADISGWDVSSSTAFDNMFLDAQQFNQDIGSWNVSSATSMAGMFGGASSFNQDIGSWDVSAVTNFTSFLSGAELSVSHYGSLLEGWSQLSLQNNVSFDVGNSSYSISANASRQSIIDDYNWSITDGGVSEVPASSEFGGETTDFSSLENVSAASVVLEKPGSAKLAWSSSVDARSQFYDRDVLFGTNWVFVNSSALHPSHNSSANITVFGSFTNPIIYRDEVVCDSSTSPACEQLVLSDSLITFSVDSFSNYSVESGPEQSSSGSSSSRRVIGGESLPSTQARRTFTLIGPGDESWVVGKSDISFSEIRFELGSAVGSVRFFLEVLDELPVSQAPSPNVYQYLSLEPGVEDASLAGPVTIDFVVANSWLESVGVSAGEVVLYRYASGSWNALDTSVRNGSGDEVLFSASSPGFSYYAIGASEPQVAVTPSLNESENETEEVFVDDEPAVGEESTDIVDENKDSSSVFMWVVLVGVLLAGLVWFLVSRRSS